MIFVLLKALNNKEEMEIKNISGKQDLQFKKLKELYTGLNQQINVISRKDMDAFWTHHVLHSLAITHQFLFEDGTQVMDLGCGGGFPGIPLAIYFPNVHFHLVDSIGKKLKVVEAVASALELKNVTVQHIRAEDIRNRKFNGVVSRAVAPLIDLWKWSHPLLTKPSEKYYGLICLKGGDLHNEISEVNRPVRLWEIYPGIYNDAWFNEKYIVQVK